MSEPTKDPRTDRSDDGPKYPTPDPQPHEAPGGLGNKEPETKDPTPPTREKP